MHKAIQQLIDKSNSTLISKVVFPNVKSLHLGLAALNVPHTFEESGKGYRLEVQGSGVIVDTGVAGGGVSHSTRSLANAKQLVMYLRQKKYLSWK